ncbi:short-chain dehydrogenase/reductase SDR [Sulfuriferula multivorans]|uniref:Short-chain dehydrogenase/reductase SDR n=1 Tax=Sulfuriferula multivorans TaxID=1559896 RepID=A0A401K023_9PROT|nr:short-chain dehydrogenase/reductase SDR [Sulfuriferula multivorans]
MSKAGVEPQSLMQIWTQEWEMRYPNMRINTLTPGPVAC